MYATLEGVLNQVIVTVDVDNIVRQRVVVLIIADALPTNLAASQLLWERYRRHEQFQVCILHWGCATHQANLTVQNAIAGNARQPLRDSRCCER